MKYDVRQKVWMCCIVAMLLVAIAVALRALFFGNLGRSTPYLTFYPAVMVAALYGGLTGGLLATALSAPACVYWIQRGFMSPVEWLALAVFLMACTMISFVCEAMLRAQTRAKRAEETLRDSNRTLEDQVLDRTAELSKTNEQLRSSEAMASRTLRGLEAALAGMTDAVFISDTAGQFIEFNDAFASFHRFRNKAECAKWLSDYTDILDVFMADGEAAPLDMWAVPRALRGETVTDAEYTLRRKDTGETWVGSYNFSPIRDKDGVIVGSVVVGRDITERKRAEEQLRKRLIQEASLRRIDEKILEGVNFREALDIACEAIMEMGYRMCWIGLTMPDHTVRPVASKGFRAGNLENMDFRWDDSPEGQGPTGISIRTGRSCVVQNIRECSCYAPWREIAIEEGILSSASFPLKCGEMEAAGVLHVYGDRVGAFSDQTIGWLEMFAQQCAFAVMNARRLEELRDTTQRLTFHVNRMPLGYIAHDLDYRVVGWNPAAERIFGWSLDEALGKHPFELIVPPEMQSRVSGLWSKLREEDESSGDSAGPALRKDGTRINCEWISTPLRDATGAMTGLVTLVHDITEKTRLEKQLLVAQKMESVGTLAGGIAHDFNNALTRIIRFGELLRMRMAGDEQALHDLDEILRCAERATTLTRQLLTYARRQVMEPVNLNLSALVADLMKLIGKLVGEHIEVKTSLEKNIPTIHADRGQIEQAVMNLCLNARDAMQEGGRLVVETGDVVLEEEYVRQNPYMRTGRYALLTVSDTGIGMDEKTRERVFDPFFTTKGPDKGTGLGLAMVYGIVKQHGGFIHLYSEPGEGTAFKVYFPAIEAQPDAVPTIRVEEILRGGVETILFAEDEEAIRALLERTLKELGYTVLVARNGEEAIEMFRQNKEIALAVLDVVMPRKGGKEAFEEMRKQNPNLKAIFMSGYSSNVIHDSFVLIAGMPFLQKPFGPTVLARKIREVLDTQ